MGAIVIHYMCIKLLIKTYSSGINSYFPFWCIIINKYLLKLYPCMLFSPGHVWLFVTSWTAAQKDSLSTSQSLPKFMSIVSVMPSNHLRLCCPLLLLPSVFPRIRVFSNESALLIRWPNYHWSFSFGISHCTEYSGLISFKIDSFDLLAFQGTLRSLLQHYRSKALILQRSDFLIVQLSYLYMTTGKTMALAIWTFVSKVMSLLFNTLFIIAFLPRKKQLSSDFMATVTIRSDF